MATVITEECINCAACEPECPNTAIYQGGVEYEFEGANLEAISADLFYIVPEKCTECVGFFEQEACAAVCPVDCCIPDPERPEDEAALLERAKVLHPDEEFPEDFPSRFKAPTAEPAQAAGGPDGAQGGSNGAAAGQTGSLASSASANSTIDDAEVPLSCRYCTGRYEVPFRFLTPGTVLRCPHCQAGFSPTQRIYLAVLERLDRWAEENNVAADRLERVVETERRRFEHLSEQIQNKLSSDLRGIVDGLTEEPKRSLFG